MSVRGESIPSTYHFQHIRRLFELHCDGQSDKGVVLSNQITPKKFRTGKSNAIISPGTGGCCFEHQSILKRGSSIRPACRPPVICMSVPVVYPEASLSRYIIAPVKSFRLPIRFIGGAFLHDLNEMRILRSK